MAFKLIISPRTQLEIENAIDYYSLYSNEAPKYFIQDLKSTYDSLAVYPFYRIKHKNIRSLKLKKFPHSLYFTVDEQKQEISVLSCFHNKRNPSKRP